MNQKKKLQEAAEQGPRDEPAKPLCVVGIGASAGGLEAISRLFEALPATTGMAFVVIAHLAPHETSHMRELLAGTTAMPVLEAAQGMAVEPDRVYVIPPNATMTWTDGRLHLEQRAPRGQHMPIDAFFRSLAFGRRSKAIGVVLSGNGTDGSLGVAAIKAEGGVAFAQDVESAGFGDMPLAAIATGCVDFTLPPAQIAAELAGVGARLCAAYQRSPEGDGDPERDEGRRQILALLRAAHEVDFTFYRQTTIMRRVLRRMVLNRIPTIGEYLEVLRDRPLELEALYQDILIKITHFFRDPETFEALTQLILPALLQARTTGAPVRIWVPGCSTGEEVYSIAIALLDVIHERRADATFQIFATDVNEAALEKARAGTYPENIAHDVSPERLRRHFVKTGKIYQINKSIRDACVFARQNVTRDPPFSRLDLISFRNVLIYLEPALQKRVIPLFHYALRPEGYLVLGASETIKGPSELFKLVDKKNKIYAKNAAPARLGGEAAGGEGRARRRSDRPLARPSEWPPGVLDVQKEADRVVMNRYAPPGVVIDSDLTIVQFRGHTGAYLEPAPGEASLNVLKMAREGLMAELRAAIHKAKRTDAAVRAEGVRLRADGVAREITVEVVPLRGEPGLGGDGADRWFLVLFEEPAAPRRAAESSPPRRAPKGEEGRVARLEHELATVREYLKVTIEEQEATNEELQSANEELLSSNEELQSINEELETAKEELQSTNEELSTLNDELGSRNAELNGLNDDLENLFASVNIPILMLSRDLRIRRFTPQAERVIGVIAGDIGRPIGDIKPRIDAPDLEHLIREVIDAVSTREREVRDNEGRWYSMRIRPYRTTDNKIDGAVLLLVDVDRLKRGAAASGPT
jgi:two-component system CheB/CheR fusion protein